MCGIVGILGTHEAAPILVEGLKRLEYRGYDSAGIATLYEGALDRRRAIGKLINLQDLLVRAPLRGFAGIGHTRWATHGAATQSNAHPHLSGPVAVVHNGIIENYKELRAELRSAGHNFASDTDTEVISALCAQYLSEGAAPVEAARRTIRRLHGAFALCFLFEGHDDLLVAARLGSPLAVGHGEGEMFVGSDALALAPMTNRVTYLEEGDMAVITRQGVAIFDASDAPATREMRQMSIDAAAAEKGPYRHFMHKEIYEQPDILTNTVQHYLGARGDAIATPELGVDLREIDRIVMVACGTASYACHVAKYWFEEMLGLPVEFDIASEFRYRNPPVSQRTLAIFVSQSGETADTLAALRYVKGRVARVMVVVNVPESSMAREADVVLPIFAGPEIGVASTKAFTCQLAVLLAFGVKMAEARGAMDSAALTEAVAMLSSLGARMEAALGAAEAQILPIAQELVKATDALFLGRGAMAPIALEGALKLKEISYIHAEGYASGELKHGPIALIDETMPVVVIAPRDALFEKTISNMEEVHARGGKIILVSEKQGVALCQDHIWKSITMPDCPNLLAPLLYAVPVQLLAYHTAVARGTDVDQPRNLAKSVTVE